MQLSKKVISKEVFDKLFRIIWELMNKKKTAKEFTFMLDDIFSINEQVMIVKRVVIVYLSLKGVSVNEISRKIGVSLSTASKYSAIEKRSKYLSSFFKAKIKKEKFIDMLEDLYFEFISPPTKYGTDWTAGWRIEMERQRKKQQLL